MSGTDDRQAAVAELEPEIVLRGPNCTGLAGRVEEISNGTLFVVPGEWEAAPPPGSRWERGHLITPAGRLDLEDLELRDGAGAATLRIEVLDLVSRARLWSLVDRLRHGVPEPAPLSDEASHIPYRGQYTETARRGRLEWLRATSGASLASLERTGLDAPTLPGNIENFVAGIEIPVGLAGPLLFQGESARGLVSAPLATTEGSLVASTSRGATAITRSGGVVTKVLAQRMTRAPAYEFEDIERASRFARWLADHRAAIDEEIRSVSQHAKLLEIDPVQIGRFVHLRFVYETADASGQNMTTACTWRACQWINEVIALVPELTPSLFVIEGNMSGDKKVSHLSFVAGRGTRVTAECFLDRATVHRVLKTTPEAIDRAHRVGVLGGQRAGMLGYNINVANVVAAMFAATGQDIGSVHESGAGIFSVDSVDGGLRATMLLPNLLVGTVGGGTGLPQQNDYLAALGCVGDGQSQRLAEIICGFALALDLSTVAAVTGGQFADAHERLGRSHRVRWLTRGDLDGAFLQPMLARALAAPDLRISSVAAIDETIESSVISELTARGERRKLIGILPLRVTCTASSVQHREVDIVAKVKPLDKEVILEAAKLASLCGGELAETYPRWRQWTGFADTHTRELAIYRSTEPHLVGIRPKVYGVYEDPEREAYVVVMERLGSDVILKDAAGEPGLWRREHIEAALQGISPVHAIWLGREQELLEEGWLGKVQSASTMAAMQELWLALAEHNAEEHAHLIDAEALARLRNLITDVRGWWAELEAMPRTLVHNDFSPRNIALRRDGLRLVAYDWELATVHVPQRDLAELLAFTLPATIEEPEVAGFVELHREALERASGVPLDRRRWRRGYRLSLWDFAISRLQLYLMAHTHREYAFLEHLAPTVMRLIEIEDRRSEAGAADLADAVDPEATRSDRAHGP